MFNDLITPVYAKSISSKLKLDYTGGDILITKVTSFDNASANSISYSKNVSSKAHLENIVLISSDINASISGGHIFSPNPRLTFAKVTNLLKSSPGFFKSS